jgi:hypothetical protein
MTKVKKVHPRLHIYIALPYNEVMGKGLEWSCNSPKIKWLKVEEDLLMAGLFNIGFGLAGWEVGIWISFITY